MVATWPWPLAIVFQVLLTAATTSPENAANADVLGTIISSRQRSRVGASLEKLTERVALLEDALGQLVDVIKDLQQDNDDLERRLAHRETCECTPVKCLHRGLPHEEGATWQDGRCYTCHCQGGDVTCQLMALSGCPDPCRCQPGGTCLVKNGDVKECQYLTGCHGSACQSRTNRCTFPPHAGECFLSLQRYYYDRDTGQCRLFTYTGCGGNVNNFETVDECRVNCLVGACCYRTTVPAAKPATSCQVLDMTSCRSLPLSLTTPVELLSFKPGQSCQGSGCVPSTHPEACLVVGGLNYPLGSSFRYGCDSCRCEMSGQVHCRCAAQTVRKEIRDLTPEELSKFQNAVQQLKLTDSASEWDQLRGVYMHHIVHANRPELYLPWHRVFLRHVERKLQSIDCTIAIPYFDFTTDAGSLATAIVWQGNYFGGDGDTKRGGCVHNHPFGSTDSWQPCLRRRFNASVPISSLLEIAVSLSYDDYMDMSTSLQTLIGYVHVFIGGDMITSGSVYDPVFLAVHSYVDMLFWQWQRAQRQRVYPAAFWDTIMVPFNISPKDVVNSEEALCVSYAVAAKGAPCNSTGERYPSGLVPTQYKHCYGADGYDTIGYDIFGVNKQGFNRDGYDENGYDINGYDCYGFNREGYNRWGFNREGVDTEGNTNITGPRWNCLNEKGVTRDGYSVYGFDQTGYDHNHCNYNAGGPYSPSISVRMWNKLTHQTRRFLLQLPRLCRPLTPLPDTWKEQQWLTNPRNVSGLLPSPVDMNISTSHWSQRFCFNVDTFMRSCDCPEGLATCDIDPCVDAVCPAVPGAKCHVSFCGKCEAYWVFQDYVVNCRAQPKVVDPDYCSPNPCQNGATCLPSVWSSEPQLVRCHCTPGYEGPRCEYEARFPCDQPLVLGNCSESTARWYLNHKSQQCEEFIYTGCLGNGNNFASLFVCQETCVVGACCQRAQSRIGVIGYTLDGYDKYGFSIEGIHKDGHRRSPGERVGAGQYDSDGYNWQGYDRDGYDRRGFDRYGYDRDGFNAVGFNVTGYSRTGRYDGLGVFGKRGEVDKPGMNCEGYSQRGLDYNGLVAGFKYSCTQRTREECEDLERRSNGRIDVISFAPAKQCDEVQCHDTCGCRFTGKLYRFGERFMLDCMQCTCTMAGTVECHCETPTQRKEIRDLSRAEWTAFHAAVKRLAKDGYASQWHMFSQQQSAHSPHSHGNAAFLPWHRFFLRAVELELQMGGHCGVAIPYFDWTVDVGALNTSQAWQANAFGGDGQGAEGCVRYHPFQDYNTPWMPCLHRQFNNSVSLPDAVDIQLLLHEEDYETFWRQVEVASGLFHMWVGGNMLTSHPAYDPVFLAHFAYVDQLWDEWQRRHPESLLRFPPEQRYVPMEPFGVTADDVWRSREQLCVEYVTITKGVLCNITLPNYGFDADGYDLHGFNKDGFDRDGFNRTGYNKQGRFDDRGIYDAYGYDREGYSRAGFDTSGFDRFGFYNDSYNRDGFNASGYDRFGYNRYGFDTSDTTPFGYHRNGSYVDGREDGVGIFDKFGYNRYNYSKFGYDRQGYDAFGFNIWGLDHVGCNYYYLGPFYVLRKYWADIQLANLTTKKLEKIHRICDPVTQLPTWWHTCKRSPDDENGSKFKQCFEDWERKHGLDGKYNGPKDPVTSDKIYVPVPPEERLCYELQLRSGCPLGEPPITCATDLCVGQTCAGFPDAVCRVYGCGDTCDARWYNGETGQWVQCNQCIDKDGRPHIEGDRWRISTCEYCFCQNNVVTCQAIDCPPVTCSHAVTPDGTCCPTCEGCLYFGEVYNEGSEVSDPTDNCRTCRCTGGSMVCRPVDCFPRPQCDYPYTPPETCCPECLNCGEMRNGTVWKNGPCTTCTCKNGNVTCEDVKCPSVSCNHPATPKDSCCPRCRGCFFEGQRYRNGHVWAADECRKCVCRHGDVKCSTKSCPPLNCAAKPEKKPGECCPVCPKDLVIPQDCVYEGRDYEHGDFFLPIYNPCLNCSCIGGRVDCSPVRCPDPEQLPCPKPVKQHNSCCLTCPGCVYKDRDYSYGDEWLSEVDPCQRCQCLDGAVSCVPREQCEHQCTHGLIQAGSCCSRCTDCVFEGTVYKNQLKFAIFGEVCRECECSHGNILCQAVPMCPRLPCKKPLPLTNRCCPICMGCVDSAGVERVEGSHWTDDSDPCLSCHCVDGKEQCQPTSCPVRCKYPEPVPGECCPRCTGCLYKGRKYRPGEVVVVDDNCSACACIAGNIICEKKICPPLSCVNSIRLPGRCCPVCRTCNYQGQVFHNATSFIAPHNPCLNCTCLEGIVDCKRLDGLCRVKCPHPRDVAGQCCPVCDGCSYKHKDYNNGQQFSLVDQPCDQCTCQNGHVTCKTKTCDPAPCPNPRKYPRECCLLCPKPCTYKGATYDDGESFKPEGISKCTECLCLRGNVTCMPKTCEPSACRHPHKPRDECCPLCEDCFYHTNVYNNGQTFTAPFDQCQTCLCELGTVTCRPVICPRTNCATPTRVPGQCCPICQSGECLYRGRRYDNDEVFTNECEDCRCEAGKVQCKVRSCPPHSCKHPVLDRCCPHCQDCNYRNKLYRDNEKFVSPDDVCQNCQCRLGTVTCRPVICPHTNCATPTRVPGQCCPICQSGECLYRGRRYDNGEVFTNECDDCRCEAGKVQCKVRSCPPHSCKHPVLDRCCPRCQDCNYRNKLYRDNEKFVSPDDVCQNCQCRLGTVTCRPVICPHTNCATPTRVPGQCCPICQSGECLYRGRRYDNGEVFTNECDDCRCEAGKVQCKVRSCPPHSCKHPVLDRCCPRCQDCNYRNKLYRDNEKFVSPDDVCQNCQCRLGTVTCRPVICPRTNCATPTRVPGQCCPICQSGECLYRGHHYDNGEVFTNECDDCRCEAGKVQCKVRSCPPHSCKHPVLDRCCPRCQDCNYRNKLYRDNEKFVSPDDVCQNCQCRLGTVTCRPVICPRTNCATPTRVPGQCCPICQSGECLYRGRRYDNGEVFTNECEDCRCEAGKVQCKVRSCPPHSCKHPVLDRCCPRCQDCNYRNKLYRDNEKFVSPDDVCQNCQCRAGSVTCHPLPCPPLTCRTPRKEPGSCCPVCPPEGCQFRGRKYFDGEMFASPENECEDCRCEVGEVHCKVRACLPHSCRHPALDRCCPRCQDCDYHNKLYRHNEKFSNPDDFCQNCLCWAGTVTCQPLPCPPLNCRAPRKEPGSCCPVCPPEGCQFRGRKYFDGEMFASPENECEDCRCEASEVHCKVRACPSHSCRHPALDRCCPRCRDCNYRNKLYRHNEKFVSPDDICQNCQCRRGSVTCRPKECHPPVCRTPRQVPGKCCPVCDRVGCEYNGRYYDDGQVFSPPEQMCDDCLCKDSQVKCSPRRCPPALCDYPIQTACCLQCTGCQYKDQSYSNLEIFYSPDDPCEECTCVEGFITCHPRPCYDVPCLHPAKNPGECCPSCLNCVYIDQFHADMSRFTSPANPCVTCICEAGTVTCERTECPPPACTHPAEGDCCPTCDGCLYSSQRYRDGQHFLNVLDVCEECACRQGNVTCGKRECPSVTCSHPVQGHCCPECTDCMYSGQRMSSGSQFTDKTNRCQICECQSGHVRCIRRRCPPIKCINPVQGECCMECRRGCLHDDKRLKEGDVVPHPKDPCMECVCQDGEMQCFRKKCQHSTCSHPARDDCGCPLCHSCQFEGRLVGHDKRVLRRDDPCETCTCMNGNVTCGEVVCPAVECTKPIYVAGQCCARCSDCEFHNERHRENSSFPHPDDICQHCQCLAGEVRCQRKKCPDTATCTHPVPGRCCHLCDRCMYQGKVYQNKQHFNPDPCVECACQDGSVKCSEIRCPLLTCPRPQRVEGVCCPTCGGCIYEGREHQDGTNWVSTENPCISCYCQGGITLCTDLTLSCITPCQEPAKLPGLCCPVCPGCDHGGVTYKSGDIFSPTGDPCDMCTCQGGNLLCQKQSCPTTVLCPQSALVPATKQACCPTCSEVHNRCTRDQVGFIVRPKDDPCYKCECKSEYNWLCMREVCPLLDCNLDDQVLTPGECCPHCRSCLLADEAIWLKSGDTWRSPLEPCLTCLCEDGLVSCNRLTCVRLQCEDGLVEYQAEGDCCAKCVRRDLLTCNYEGKVYQPGENFTVDVCTTCKCVGLEVKCHTKQCVRPECNSEEIPSLVPGICCPKCILKPATCIGYGDPHYRTFDGALVHMQGMCKYVMSADCKNNDFSVEVQHHDLDGGGVVSWVESVTLRLELLTIDLLQGGTVMVNNVTVTLPYLNEPLVSIELLADTIILNTNIGLGILWDRESRVEVSLSGSYKERVCGLCGNFNQFSQDDMTTKTGRIVASAATFGNSWRVVTDRYCPDAEDVDPCSTAGYRMRKLANTKCAVLKSKLFQPCHRMISPEPYFASCVYDMCVCGDSESCLCDVLETYALQCSKAGVALRWRSESLCAIGCAEEKGFLFDECGPPCARTCANKDMPISSLAEQCFKPCVPGCQCPAHLVLYKDRCVPIEECP